MKSLCDKTNKIQQSMEPVKVDMKHFKEQSKFILLAITILYNPAALLHKHSKAEFSPIHSNLRHNLGARST